MPTKDGYTFQGWFTHPGGQGTQVTDSSQIGGVNNLYAVWAQSHESGFHAQFIQGYPDGTFRPGDFVTRAQAATMLTRTLVPDYSPTHTPPSGMRFSDVSPSDWFHNYVAWAHHAGFINGYEDGTFRPNNPITREELAALMTRASGYGIIPVNGFSFTDANQISNWARDYVYTASLYGWISGDANGTFRPTQQITRAETAALLSRVLGRRAINAESIKRVYGDIQIFYDVADSSKWYYYYVIEASHSHWYIIKDGIEVWTSVSH